MRVVVATDDKINLNGHFALATTFLFYDVCEESCELLQEAQFLPDNDFDMQNKYQNRKPFCVEERLEAIRGSDVVFVSAIGGPIADRVIAQNVYPIEMNAIEPIDVLLTKLQALLKGKQPLWLQRILRHDFFLEGRDAR